jgi:hypothetical protein
MVRWRGNTYVQYWTYYPDSNTTLAKSDWLWRLLPGAGAYPGYHRDDWEAIAIRVDRDGRFATRVTSHGHWQSCKHSHCRGRWGKATGWARVSRGSHAGHIPLELADERTSTPDAIRLVPLETVDRRRYRRLDPDIAPPWEKDAYENPESSGS